MITFMNLREDLDKLVKPPSNVIHWTMTILEAERKLYSSTVFRDIDDWLIINCGERYVSYNFTYASAYDQTKSVMINSVVGDSKTEYFSNGPFLSEDQLGSFIARRQSIEEADLILLRVIELTGRDDIASVAFIDYAIGDGWIKVVAPTRDCDGIMLLNMWVFIDDATVAVQCKLALS
jgi:hypothetical protein